MGLNGKDPGGCIPFTFIFKGPPGTSKTSTARKLGRIFHEMGFFLSDEVVEYSAMDILGMYMAILGPRCILQA